MNTDDQSCCVCSDNHWSLNTLSRKDGNNITLLTKLQGSIPQIEWQVTFQICSPCTNLLSIVYTFRETCIKSDILRKQLETVNELKNEVECVKLENNIQDSFEDNEIDNDIKDDYKNHKEFDVDFNYLNHNDDVKDFKVDIKAHITDDFIEQNSSNLLQRIKDCDAIQSNMCAYCGKGFITKSDLNNHEKQHLNKRKYKCETCTKSFNAHRNLRSHIIVVHADPQLWKYFCETCNKRFPIKSYYDCHIRRHTGEKKFVCHQCQKRFTDKCVLQRHMRSHTNIRDFKCSECEKEYKDKRVMQIHMATIHEIGIGEIKLPSKERKHSCHMCPQAFYAKNKLRRHLYTHSGEKPFFCTMCDRRFIDKSYLKQHMKRGHKIDTGANK